MKLRSILIVFVLLFANVLFADVQRQTLYTGDSLNPVSLEQVVAKVQPGDVVIVSEYHNNVVHHQHQHDFLKALTQQKPELKVSLGMEFFEYTDQHFTDSYMRGDLAEDKFLRAIGWTKSAEFLPMPFQTQLSGYSYDFYRPLVLHPLMVKGWSYGINAPRKLTSKVAKEGIESLSEIERILLPPHFQLGQQSYKDRFSEVIGGGHPVPENKIIKYFTAQSIWDDTMAWQTLRVMKQDPEQVFVIIVGDFHNAYGDGLPARLRARGAKRVVTISQVDITGYSDEEAREEIAPHPLWGVRADYVWTN